MTRRIIKEAAACDNQPLLCSNRRPVAQIDLKKPMIIFKHSSQINTLQPKSYWFNSTRVVGRSNRRESVADRSFRRWRKHRSNKWLASCCLRSLVAINTTGAAMIKAKRPWWICNSYSISSSRMPVASCIKLKTPQSTRWQEMQMIIALCHARTSLWIRFSSRVYLAPFNASKKRVNIEWFFPKKDSLRKDRDAGPISVQYQVRLTPTTNLAPFVQIIIHSRPKAVNLA